MAQVRKRRPGAAQHRKPLVPLWRAPGTVACLGADLSLFFPPEDFETDEQREARTWRATALCRRCPFTSGCLEAAMAEEMSGPRFGIRGGLDPDQRKRLQAARTRREVRARAAQENAA